MDWYEYLTPEFKLDRKTYRVNDRYSFDCPKCGTSSVARLNHIKRKINDLGYYECSKCRKQDSIQRAREIFKDKYGDVNPYQLETVKDKIKSAMKEKYGVECVLSLSEVHKKGIEAASSDGSRLKAMNTQFENHGSYNLQRPEIKEKSLNAIKQKAKNKRNKWKRDGGKICGHCKKFKKKEEYSSMKFPSSKCKVCTNLYHNEYSIIRKSILGYSNEGESLLGCTIPEFTDYIESQFKTGMNWNNWSRNGWHLDHIIPLKFISESNKHIIHNYRNFRPLWSSENQSKNDRLPKLIFLTGPFGSGKSTISQELSNKFTILDKDLKHDIYDIAASSIDIPVIYQASMNVVKDIKLFKQFFNDIKIVIIQEDIEEIEERIICRKGTFNKSSIENRIKRMSSIAKKYGTFTGTAQECFEFLNSLC